MHWFAGRSSPSEAYRKMFVFKRNKPLCSGAQKKVMYGYSNICTEYRDVPIRSQSSHDVLLNINYQGVSYPSLRIMNLGNTLCYNVFEAEYVLMLSQKL